MLKKTGITIKEAVKRAERYYKIRANGDEFRDGFNNANNVKRIKLWRMLDKAISDLGYNHDDVNAGRYYEQDWDEIKRIAISDVADVAQGSCLRKLVALVMNELDGIVERREWQAESGGIQ